jgi:hypothetical protein
MFYSSTVLHSTGTSTGADNCRKDDVQLPHNIIHPSIGRVRDYYLLFCCHVVMLGDMNIFHILGDFRLEGENIQTLPPPL